MEKNKRYKKYFSLVFLLITFTSSFLYLRDFIKYKNTKEELIKLEVEKLTKIHKEKFNKLENRLQQIKELANNYLEIATNIYMNNKNEKVEERIKILMSTLKANYVFCIHKNEKKPHLKYRTYIQKENNQFKVINLINNNIEIIPPLDNTKINKKEIIEAFQKEEDKLKKLKESNIKLFIENDSLINVLSCFEKATKGIIKLSYEINSLFEDENKYQIITNRASNILMEKNLINIINDEILRNIKNIKEGSIIHNNFTIIFSTNEELNLKILTIVQNYEIQINGLEIKNILIKMSIKLVIAISSFLLVLLIYKLNSIRYMWLISCSYTLTFIACSIFIQYLNYDISYSHYSNNLKITSLLKAKEIIQNSFKINPKLNNKDLIEIPTGINIKYIEIDQGYYKANISGYIWQKYPLGAEVTRGIYFPDLIKEGEISIFHREEKDNYEIIVWKFNVSLYQDFKYKKYPFDLKEVKVRITPKSISEAVILIPDINGYKKIDPYSGPGVKKEIKAQGWEKILSYFSYNQDITEKLNLGTNNYIKMSGYPELLFNIILRRSISSILVTNILPITVILLILFFGIIMLRKDESESPRSFDLLNTSSGLFFTIVFSHIEVRRSLSVREIIYLEYLYFLLYLTMIFIIIDSYLFRFKSKILFISYNNNLIPKVIFWPLLSFIFLIITLFVLR